MLFVRTYEQVNPRSKIRLPNVWSNLKPYCEWKGSEGIIQDHRMGTKRMGMKMGFALACD